MGRNWISSFLYCLFVTNVSSMIMYTVFLLLKNKMEKYGLFNLQYIIIKFILVSYIVPFVYILIYYSSIHKDVINVYQDSALGFVDIFRMTPFLYYFSRVTFFLWIISSIRNLGTYRKMVIEQIGLIKSFVPCDYEIQTLFDDTKNIMGIKANIHVGYSDTINSPGVVGIMKPTILLPVKTYSQKELKIIAYHELVHFKHKDVIWRYLLLLISCVFVIPQKHNYLFRNLEDYSELSCDEKVILLHDISIEDYYITIAEMSGDFQDSDRKEFLPSLYENKNSLERRVMRMVYKGNKSGKMVALFSTLFVLCNLFIFSFTSLASAKVYSDIIYEQTNDEQLEVSESAEVDSIEFMEPAKSDEYEYIIQFNPRLKSTGNIGWNISSGSSIRTSYFNKSKESTITVMLSVEPSSGTIKAGIIEPDGSRRYVNSSNGLVSHTFTVNKAGDHAVYIENTGSAKVTVSGVFVY